MECIHFHCGVIFHLLRESVLVDGDVVAAGNLLLMCLVHMLTDFSPGVLPLIESSLPSPSRFTDGRVLPPECLMQGDQRGYIPNKFPTDDDAAARRGDHTLRTALFQEGICWVRGMHLFSCTK